MSKVYADSTLYKLIFPIPLLFVTHFCKFPIASSNTTLLFTYSLKSLNPINYVKILGPVSFLPHPAFSLCRHGVLHLYASKNVLYIWWIIHSIVADATRLPFIPVMLHSSVVNGWAPPQQWKHWIHWGKICGNHPHK